MAAGQCAESGSAIWGSDIVRRADGDLEFLVYRERARHMGELFSVGLRWGQRTHLVQDGRRVSFADCAQQAARVSARLAKEGAAPGDRVLVLAANSPEWIAAFWGILLGGHVVVLGNAWWSEEELAHAISLTGARHVLTDQGSAATAASLPNRSAVVLGLDDVTSDAGLTAADPPSTWVGSEDDPAVIVFTSGSTGLPKGAVLSHRACIAVQHALLHLTRRLPQQIADDNPADVNLQTGPLFHIGGLQGLIRGWLLGATLVFARTSRFDPDEVVDLIEHEKVARWGAVPTTLRRVVEKAQVGQRDLTSLRSLTVGGSKLPDDLIDAAERCFPSAKTGVNQIYGLTECGGTVTMASQADLKQHPHTVGRPLPVVEIRINGADSDGVGEILARTPAQMSGYLGGDDEPMDADGWMHTGDLGRIDEDGYLYLTGRSKDVIIRGGENIASGNVERVIQTHQAVAEVAVLGLPDADLGEIVAAVVVLREPGSATVEELVEFARSHLAYFEVPARWSLRADPLPINPSGKVDKGALHVAFGEDSGNGHSDVDDVASRDRPKVRMAEAVLDESMIERMRGLVGTELRIDHSVNNEEATRLAVRRFVEAIGDPNQLWVDPDLAAATDYGRAVAPPSFVMGCFSGLQFGWPGLGAFHSASDISFLKPVFVGDTIKATCRYEGFDGPRPSSFAAVMVTDEFLNSYTNQHGERVAEIRWHVMNFMRQKAAKSTPENTLQLPHPWTVAEVEEIEKRVLAERPRGAEPRWWDEVRIGDPVDEIIKGPIGITDEVAYVAAGGPPIPRLAANGVALRMYERHPAWAFRDPHTMALEPVYAVHYNEAAAHAMGVAMQYDVGFQRQCWHIHLLTDWIGDSGWIVRASAQYRGFVYHGDVLRLGGEVVATSTGSDGEGLVEVKTWALNQRGQDVMPGTATLALPLRGTDSPVRRRVA